MGTLVRWSKYALSYFIVPFDYAIYGAGLLVLLLAGLCVSLLHRHRSNLRPSSEGPSLGGQRPGERRAR